MLLQQMSNNNRPWQNPNDLPVSSSFQYTQPQKFQKYSINSSAPNYYNESSRQEAFDLKSGQQNFKTNQFDGKQKNKAMYYSTINFTNDNNKFASSLSSFGRRINQSDVQESDKGSSSSGFTTQSSKYSDMHNPPSFKMPTSPNFSSSGTQFNQFPAFNLNPNKKNDSSVKPLNQVVARVKQNETVKQKRQREIAQIKKQLESLNNKMINKPIPTISAFASQQSRPMRNPGISQSAIFDQQSNIQPYFSSNNNNSQNKSLQNGGSSLTIDQLYVQKKYPQSSINKYESSSLQNSSISSNDHTTNTSMTGAFHDPSQFSFGSKITNIDVQQQKLPQFGYKSLNEQKISFSSQVQMKNNNNSNIDKSPKTRLFSFSQKPSSSQSSIVNSYSKGQQTSLLNQQANDQGGGAFKKKKNVEPTHQLNNQKQFNNYNAINQSKIPKRPQSYSAVQNKSNKFDSFQFQNSSINNNSGIRKINSIDYNYPTNQKQTKKFKMSDFVVGKKMGKGQFGQVLLVKHKLTGWICGLKVMQKKQIRQQQYVQQIARQLSIQFYLEHRNVAQLYGYFQDETKFYLLIQFCSGGQLLQKLRSQKRMCEKDVAKTIRQVCEGVDYIHKQLIIHRDLKPQNILFNFGTVKISDFGWAVYRGFGMRKTASGSPLYYPPEIVKGEQYDDKIDVWNIGMMTYQCLLGKIPFRVYSQLDLGRIVSDQITFPSWVDVSDQAKDFILKTMKKKGQQRMQIRQMLRHPLLTKNQQMQLDSSILEEFKRVLS